MDFVSVYLSLSWCFQLFLDSQIKENEIKASYL
jgi:hypothetical protein